MAHSDESPTHISALPLPLFLRILALVPADTRLRCAEVSRAWRDAVADVSLWTRIDLTAEAGVAWRLRFGPLLLAAAARAGGQLQALDVCDREFDDVEEEEEDGHVRQYNDEGAVLDVARANSRTLTELYAPSYGLGEGHEDENVAEKVADTLRAAPLLRELHTSVAEVTLDDAHRMLRNEPPFGPLRLRELEIVFPDDAVQQDITRFAADLRAHPTLTVLELFRAPLHTAAALDDVVDAALALQLTRLGMYKSGLHPGSVPSLARLLGSAVALPELHILNDHAPLLDAHSAALLSVALRANRSLTVLQLWQVGLWHEPAAGAAMVLALVAHPTLSSLMLADNHVPVGGRDVVGGALSELLKANSPALRTLMIDGCALGDAGCDPLFDALPHNTHLRTLDCAGHGVSAAFAAQRLLPAVRANTSLRSLSVDDGQGYAGLEQAQQLVWARRKRDDER